MTDEVDVDSPAFREGVTIMSRLPDDVLAKLETLLKATAKA